MELKMKMARKFNSFERQNIITLVIIGCFLALMAFAALPRPAKVSSPTVSMPLFLRAPSNIQSSHKKELKTEDENTTSGNTLKRDEVSRIEKDSSTDPMKSSGVDEEETSMDLEKTTTIKKNNQRKPLCDISSRRADLCEMTGDIRITGNTSITLFATSQAEPNSWKIKPYARKGDNFALSRVRELLVSSNIDEPPSCTHNHTIPAVVFSIHGYAGNIFHDFTDIIIPLFLTSYQYDREVQFAISDMNIGWVRKYQLILQKLSRYPILDLDKVNSDEVNCFPEAIVGLRCNKELSIDLSKSPNGYSMMDFTRFLRSTLSLERDTANRARVGEVSGKKPRLLIIPRKRIRTLLNVDEIKQMAEEMGFEVVVAEPTIRSDVVEFARIVNSCDVMMGVHGAGLTNLVYLPTTAVLIQIVPWGGLEGISMMDFGEPAKDTKLNYLQYSIAAEESTLTEKFPMDHPVIRDPMSFHGRGWFVFRETYMDTQDVRLNLVRFRPVLEKALELLH